MSRPGSDGRIGHHAVELITPSYLPDLDLCDDLCESVRRLLPRDWQHRVIVPERDLPAFTHLRRRGAVVVGTRRYLPDTYLPLPKANVWLNYRRPWPPIRGWIAQQVVKLAAAAESTADMVVVVDSDIAFVRDVDGSTFVADGRPVFYRHEGAVHDGMPRHVLWHRVAHRLLGLPPPPDLPLPDYISWPSVWEPAIVRPMLARVAEKSGGPWQTAVGGQPHFSEMVLYGVYVDHVLDPGERPAATDDMHCVNHHVERPLGPDDVEHLQRSLRPTDVAVMVSAKSGTQLTTRRDLLSRLRLGSGDLAE